MPPAIAAATATDERDGLGVLLEEGRLVAVPERPHAGMDRQERFATPVRRGDGACERNEVHHLAAVLEQHRCDLGDHLGGNVFAPSPTATKLRVLMDRFVLPQPLCRP